MNLIQVINYQNAALAFTLIDHIFSFNILIIIEIYNQKSKYFNEHYFIDSLNLVINENFIKFCIHRMLYKIKQLLYLIEFIAKFLK